MNKKTLAAIVLSMAGIFGSGCNSNNITEFDIKNPPTITGKEHQAEREYDQDDYIPVWCGVVTS